MIMLQSQASTNISLADALDKCAIKFVEAVGLFYSPTDCCLAKVNGAEVIDAAASTVDLSQFFEARIFNHTAELRWLNELGGLGRAALLSDDEQEVPLILDEPINPLKVIDINDQLSYILWGQVDHSDEQWSYLSESRIGSMAVPLGNQTAKGRIHLKVREYFSCHDAHGNAVVAEERLLGLAAVPASQKSM